MLAAYKSSEDKNHLEFWASSIFDQNDKEELSITAKEIMPVVQEIEHSIKKKGFTDFHKLSTVDEQWWIPTLTGQLIKENVSDFFQYNYNIPYTVSFSQHEDKLLMWSMYANNGNGICLAFDENKLVDHNVYKFVIPDIVLYKKEPQNLKKIIKKFYDMYIKELENEIIINIIYNLKRKYWESMLMGISPFIKNEAFKDEAEYRIVYYQESHNNPQVYTRMTNRLNVIHYIKAKIPLEALHHIIIGPCANFAHAKILLVENLKTCNIVNDYDGDFIRISNVPYRMY